SSVSPRGDSAITTSSSRIAPRSPWMASAGRRKNAGVPVLESVAAILRLMMPDLPLLVMMAAFARPVHYRGPAPREEQRQRALDRAVEPIDQAEDRRRLDAKHLARQLQGRCGVWSSRAPAARAHI